MLLTLLACVVAGLVLSRPLIRAMRRDAADLGVIRRTDYLRTRRASRLSRVSSNSFGVRL